MPRSTRLTVCLGFTVALLLSLGLQYLRPSPVAITPPPPTIGTNLAGIADWSTQMPFIDGFKSSRPWIAQCDAAESGCRGNWSTGEEGQLDLDEHGWVRSLPAAADPPEYTRAGTLLYRGVEDYPAGTYHVRYEGRGELRYDYDAKRIATAPGEDTLDVSPSEAGIFLQIVATDPQDYIRNIRVIPATYESALTRSPFNPVFLEKTQPFGVLRFMDWMATNDSQQETWANRPQPQDATYAARGVPVEVMVDLANTLGRSPWFNMPHRADEDYVRQFARYVNQHLDPNLPIYVESSNEVWNGQFDQADYAAAEGQRLKLGSGANESRHRWHGKRTAEVLQIWEAAFGADRDRIVGVLGAQAANDWTAEQALEYLRQQGIFNADAGIDAIAIAPYISLPLSEPKAAAALEQWVRDDPEAALDRLFTEISQGGVLAGGHAGGAVQQAFDRVTDYIELTRREDLALVAYEGGQHLAPLHNGMENNRAIVDLFIAANRDPRIGQVYQDYLARWQEQVGGLFVHFSDITAPGKWGSWGALESLYQTQSPKYDALMQAIGGGQ